MVQTKKNILITFYDLHYFLNFLQKLGLLNQFSHYLNMALLELMNY